MQQGMLLQSLHEPGVYLQQLVCDLHEDLKESVLFKAWQEVTSRHDVLRTAFRWEEIPEPLQDVYEKTELPWFSEDWCQLTFEQQEQQYNDFLSRDRSSGFVVTRPPLMRFACFKLGPMHSRLVWTFHHSLLDGRSHRMVLQEVFGLYDDMLAHVTTASVTRLPYSEYINWLNQQKWPCTQEFWSDYLRGYQPKPDLRVGERGFSNVPLRAREPAEQSLALSANVCAALEATAKEHQITVNTLIQAGWALLLGRHYGSQDIVFGVARACRHSGLPEAKSMVGLFINTLPLRVQLDPQRSLLQLLKQLRQQQLTFRDYEETPLTMIQEWSEAPRGRSLFETVLVFENYELNEQMAASKRLAASSPERHFTLLEQTHYPLTLAAYAGSKLILKLEYDERRFQPESVEAMLSSLAMVLEGMATNPNLPVGQFSMLDDSERRRQISEWNETGKNFPDGVCLHELFAAQVRRTPERVAVVFGDQRLSFAELDKRANQLAHHLRRLDVMPETLVGICLERSLELVVAMLAVLKAGAAYVPIDPAFPSERVSFMLADAGVKVLLTERRLGSKWHQAGLELVYPGKDGGDFSAELAHEPERMARADNPAYVIYTSGSTGQPKGVVITHRAICNHMQWMQDEFPLNDNDCVLQKTSVSFDASVWEFYAPLLAGARLVLAQPNGQRDPSYLHRVLRDDHVTTLQVVPSQLLLLLSENAFFGCTDLRRVFCGGEPLQRELVDNFRIASEADLINLYGPTEACIDATFHKLDRSVSGGSIPIGRPIANMKAYILDQFLEPVPVGVSGELYLAGAPLARGYWRRPNVTAEYFLPDPFSGTLGARLYRTGDRVHYLPKGIIAYEGRVDHQVKLLGFRIELGEIENCLASYPGVDRCTVVVRQDGGRRKLVAYVVRGQALPATNELRSFLMSKLPEYMVPAVFVYLDHLPLSENGKLDRSALPIPPAFSAESEFVGPRNATEEIIAGIWCEVLGLKAVSVLQDFFAVGGDSLRATQVGSRASAVFQIDLPLGALFEWRTIAALAEAVEEMLIEELEQRPEDDTAAAAGI